MLINKLKYTLFGIAILLAGCTDLSETLRSDISADVYYSNVDGFEDLTKAMYQPLIMYYIGTHGSMATSSGTDLFRNGASGASRAAYHSYDSGLNPSISGNGPHQVWNHFYRGINLANSVIDRADDVDGITENLKNRRVAEARFLRAHYYHILVQNWGDVHLTLEETTGVETEATRTPEEDIWAVVIEDLKFAADNLPIDQSDVGRATANAARHHLARVHLILENWDEAANWATEVINSGQYSLIDSFTELWDPYETPIGGYNDETIWGITKNHETGGAAIAREYTSDVRNLPGIQATWHIGNSSSRYRANDYFVTEIFNNDPARTDVPNHWNDERYQASFKDVWYYNHPASLPSGVALGDTAAYLPAAKKYQEMSDEEVAEYEEKHNYHLYRIQDWHNRLWLSISYKFRYRGDETPETSLSALGWWPPGYTDRTVPVFRLAETYLIAAEAHMMMGNSGQAAEYFNTVRQRAETPGHEIPLVSPGDLDIDEILDERARELAGEFLRWYDLKRTGKFMERIQAHNPEAGPNVQEYHMLRPIPQAQIDRTTNEYPQNPGY